MEFTAQEEEELEQTLGDKWYRLNNLYHIKNKQEEFVQFTPNKVQTHFNKNAWFRNIILKSRQLGFTTWEAIDMLDDVLYTPNKDALFIAQNLDTAKDIFDNKIKLAWDSFEYKNTYSVDMESARRLKLEFGDGTHSSITVDSSGRAGTFHRLHITELAIIGRERPERAKEIVEGSIPAVPTNGRVDIESTSEGVGGRFHEMFMSAWGHNPTHPEQFKAHFYNWTWDPETETMEPITNLPVEFVVYQKEHGLNDRQIAYYYRKWLSLAQNWNALKKEYPTTPEEAFEVVIEGAYYKKEVDAMVNEKRYDLVPHSPEHPVFTVWDLGKGENMAVGFFQRYNNRVFMIDHLEGEKSDGLPTVIAKVLNKHYVYGGHFAPHDIRQTSISTEKTRWVTASELGIKFQKVPEVSFEDGIDKVKTMCPKLWINSANCKKFFTAIKQYRKDYDNTTGYYKSKPVKDWTNHSADVLRYCALCENEMVTDNDFRNFKQDPWEQVSEYEGGTEPDNNDNKLLKEMGMAF